jgi:lipopolysaccharide/colanic/teichoic acid biosynthesis glycosyltransferase
MTYRDQFGHTWMTAFSSDLRSARPNALTDIVQGPSTHWRRDSTSRRLTAASRRFGSLTVAARRNAPSDADAARRVRRQVRRKRHVLTEELFRCVLQREQRCAERFEQRLVLLLVRSDAAAVSQQPVPCWTAIIDALTAAAGDTALVGWLEKDRVLGAVVPQVGGPDHEALLRREFGRRLETETLARVAVRTHVYSPDAVLHPNEGAVADVLRNERPASRSESIREGAKRVVDILGSLALLVVLSPLFAAIAALLKLTSRGPILFRQPRIGRMGKPFTMLKFRTMRVNADPALHRQFVTQFIKGDDVHSAGPAAMFKITNDPRVTPLGRVLRKTSLDELPQFWNVLRGEMSLVGPRPPLAYEVEQYRPWHWRRMVDAKPGITGLWQVNGRSRTTFDEMVRLDLRYARRSSLWMDIKILLATPRAVFSGKGAA